MWFLITQIWLALLVAFALGWFSHWVLCCRNKDSEELEETAQANLSEESG